MEYSGLVVGRDRATTERLLTVAVAVFVAVFVFHTPPSVLGVDLAVRPNLAVLFGLATVLPVAGAYLNDGALVSVALAAGPALGFYVPLTLFELVSPSESVLWGVASAATFAVPLGLVGFAVGAGARRLVALAL
ncbi:hypothetical protein [Halorussus marinus]|uniref:hypothetical protein n=1 Tax=Halorussus marinus TaxID=2505976 RepID=UPI0010931521|nr:hypothetical protein [Halorussus marinus]